MGASAVSSTPGAVPLLLSAEGSGISKERLPSPTFIPVGWLGVGQGGPAWMSVVLWLGLLKRLQDLHEVASEQRRLATATAIEERVGFRLVNTVILLCHSCWCSILFFLCIAHSL